LTQLLVEVKKVKPCPPHLTCAILRIYPPAPA
jgi:hypothetical protein